MTTRHAQRLRPMDCVMQLLHELQRDGMTLEVHDAELRERWEASVNQVLQAVPDSLQRWALARECAAILYVRWERVQDHNEEES